MKTDSTGMFIKRNTVPKKHRWVVGYAEEWDRYLAGQCVGWPFEMMSDRMDEVYEQRDRARLVIAGMTAEEKAVFAQALRMILRHDFEQWAMRRVQLRDLIPILESRRDTVRLDMLKRQIDEHEKQRPARVSMSLRDFDLRANQRKAVGRASTSSRP